MGALRPVTAFADSIVSGAVRARAVVFSARRKGNVASGSSLYPDSVASTVACASADDGPARRASTARPSGAIWWPIAGACTALAPLATGRAARE